MSQVVTGPRITGVHHISFTVSNLDDSLDWYQRLFSAERCPA
ncbi:hypothetical protein ACFVYV_44495 [Streptomyces mirabilis]